MAPQYKLTYFNAKGIGEPIRMLFHYAKVEFEDVRVEPVDWPAMKQNMPWGVLPVLEEDGKHLSQSLTILRYVGRKLKLAGADESQTAKCDEYVDAMADIRLECMASFKQTDETKKAEQIKKIQEESLPRIIKKFEEILEKNGNGFLVGNSVTYADVYVANFLSQLCELLGAKDKLDSSKGVLTFCTKIFNLPGIKEWIVERPVTAF